MLFQLKVIPEVTYSPDHVKLLHPTERMMVDKGPDKMDSEKGEYFL